MDCSGSIKYLLHSICYSYQGGGKHCLMVCDLMHGGKKKCCILSRVFYCSKVTEVAGVKNTHVGLPTTRYDLLNHIQFLFLWSFSDGRA